MEEVLNQEQTTADDGLFDDYVEAEIEDKPISNEAENNESSSTENVDTTPFLKIRFNKEDVDLTQEKAIELSQKGMNYDKLYEKYDSTNKRLESLANANGLSVEDFLDKLNETQQQLEISNEVNALKEKYPTADDELLKELAKKNVIERAGDKAQYEQKRLEKEKEAERQEAKRQLDIFKEEYPNVDIEKINPSVFDLVKQGYTLLEAYGKWARKEAEKSSLSNSVNATSQNAENKSRNYGNLNNVGSVESDDFMAGWNDV